MSNTTEKNNVNTNRSESVTFHRPHPWRFGRDADADVTRSMPSADEYREGMDRLRAEIDCPVLGVNAMSPVAQADLAHANESMQSMNLLADADDLAMNKRCSCAAKRSRPSADEYLKAQHREALLKRLPAFEQNTITEIEELKQEMRHLNFKTWISHCALAAVIVLVAVARLF